jgi:hypothetical protein
MHLGVFWLGTGNHTAGWRYEGAATSNNSWPLVAAGAQQNGESLICSLSPIHWLWIPAIILRLFRVSSRRL